MEVSSKQDVGHPARVSRAADVYSHLTRRCEYDLGLTRVSMVVAMNNWLVCSDQQAVLVLYTTKSSGSEEVPLASIFTRQDKWRFYAEK